MSYIKLANIHDTDSKVPYMMQNGEKVYFRSNDVMFQNAHCLFIEYTDIIRSPYFIFLTLMMKSPEKFSKYYKLDIFDNYDIEGLSEWYIHRKNQNPLVDLLTDEARETLSEEKLDEFINEQIIEHKELIELSPLLNLGNVLFNLSEEVVKSVVIWYPYKNSTIEKDIHDTFGDGVKFMYGNLFNVLDQIPKDSTYIFSDITNIDLLYEKKKLHLSSIIIPNEYGYNYINDDILKINVDEYQKDVVFKLDFFSASIQVVENKDIE